MILHLHLARRALRDRIGAFVYDTCRCGRRRITWFGPLGVLLWSSSWGTAEQIERERRDYTREAMHG